MISKVKMKKFLFYYRIKMEEKNKNNIINDLYMILVFQFIIFFYFYYYN